jgi:creatinine amidohydrolase
MDDEIISQYSFDHAGIGETSLMMELAPETVDMDRLDTSKWYLESAREANREFGAKGAAMVLERMRRILTESRLEQP